MIYLYDYEKMDYIVVFEDKVLISNYFYEVKNSVIEFAFLREYYQSIE